MEVRCRQCGAVYLAAVEIPLTGPVRVACPACSHQMTLRPAGAARAQPAPAGPPAQAGRELRHAVVADEPRPFRTFLGGQLQRLGFEVTFCESGGAALDLVRRLRAELIIVNVYLKGKLGVEVSEEIRRDPDLGSTCIVLIGALFRANRFRANPTNLYGADEYIEEQIPEKELRQIIRKLVPGVGSTVEMAVEPEEFEEARRLARLILSDIVIYNGAKVEQGIREGSFFRLLEKEIEDGRQYYESRVPLRIRQTGDLFAQTLQQFQEAKREELQRARSGA
jgi:CheY-like chemotaxis protein